ncbi:DUF4145 domain-containing protein [Roseateles sp. PN1]|uniref:DUF4145 domain-containing protein n=1 Tax=Roseateles sp. PN1 TaxID=3137372 RepID=UPI0031386EE3
MKYGWQQWYEAFCVCRHCRKASIFVLAQATDPDKTIVHRNGLVKLTGAVNQWMRIEGIVSKKDDASVEPPQHLPQSIEAAFREGAMCLAVSCYNAAGTMFRLCVDLATQSLLPEGEVTGLNPRVRRDLGLRLPWLFTNHILPAALHDLSTCIKDDGNDGAHAGTLGKEDAEDLLDFTTALLERLYTEPEVLKLAKERREARRAEARKDS